VAYNHSQLARECGAVKTPSARLLLMVLASAMDKDKHTCAWRVSTLLQYTKLSMPTYKRAMNEIELAGIITRDKRLGKSNTFIWHPDVAESLRDPVKKDWAEPSAEDKENMERMDMEGDEPRPKRAFEIDDTDTVPADVDEEFPCAQCKIEPVLVAGSRCSACRKADERVPPKPVGSQRKLDAILDARKRAAHSRSYGSERHNDDWSPNDD
jgi:hypothetical protein